MGQRHHRYCAEKQIQELIEHLTTTVEQKDHVIAQLGNPVFLRPNKSRYRYLHSR